MKFNCFFFEGGGGGGGLKLFFNFEMLHHVITKM